MSSQPYRPESGRHHVVIVGAGFAGLFATKQLAKADVDITLIDQKNHHLFQPLLYQVATGILSSGEIAPTIRDIMSNQDNVEVVKATVTDIDIHKQTVRAESGSFTRVYAYDDLIIGAGANQSYFGNDHFARFAPGMKTIDDALEIRARIVGAFERAEITDDPAERERLLTFVIVGGGPTGVELAGQLAEMAHRTLPGRYSHFAPTSAKIILLDGAPQVLMPFGKRLGRKAQRQLEKMGVTVRTNTLVTNVDDNGVTYKSTKDGSEQHIPSYCKIWSAGVEASPLGAMIANQAGVDTDRAGRVLVNPDLTVGDYHNVFITGDMISLNKLPGVAQTAIQSGEYVADLIANHAEYPDKAQEVNPPFEYMDKGSMATISRFSAVVKLGNVEITGFIGWVLWLIVHIMYLVGFRNRLVAMVEWGINTLSRKRSNLAVTTRQRISRVEELHLDALENEGTTPS